MAGDAYLIEETLQLTDNGGNLRGQIIRVHGRHQFGMPSYSSRSPTSVVQELSCENEAELRECA